MKRKTRRILFLISLLLFCLLAPAIILYSQGYRFDIKTKKLVKTGAIFLKVTPKGANVYLNKKLVKKKDNFFGTLLINYLIPDSYQLKITKENYYPWEKNLRVFPGQVTEVKNIFLIPEKINLKLIETGISAVFPSYENTSFVLKKDKENSEDFFLFDEKGIITFLFSLPKDHTLENLIWGENEKLLLISTTKEKEAKKYFFEFSLEDKELSPLEGLPDKITSVSLLDQEELLIFFLDPETQTLFSYSLKNYSLEPIVKNVSCYQLQDNILYGISKDGSFFKSDIAGNLTILNLLPFSSPNNCQLIISLPFFFVKTENNFFLFNKKTKTFEPFIENKEGIIFSPDNKKVAIKENGELLIVHLLKENGQPQKKEKEKTFLARLSVPVHDIFWLNDFYLIFSTNQEIKIIESDDRDRVQQWLVQKLTNPKIFWETNKKRLFIFSEGRFFESNSLSYF